MSEQNEQPMVPEEQPVVPEEVALPPLVASPPAEEAAPAPVLRPLDQPHSPSAAAPERAVFLAQH